MKKNAQGKVDQFRCTLEVDRDIEYLRIANQPNQNITVLHRWLIDEGFKGSYQSVCNWHGQWKKNGVEADLFNQVNESYSGVVPEKALQKIVVVFGNLLDDYIQQINDAEAGTINPGEYLKIIPHIAREVRSCAGVIHQLKYLSDRREIENAGAYRLAQELRLTFEDSPFQSALEEGVRGAIARMETEG